jgi:hypothetical protein
MSRFWGRFARHPAGQFAIVAAGLALCWWLGSKLLAWSLHAWFGDMSIPW